MKTHDSTTRALRDLDAAGRDQSEAQRIRAAATLERILADTDTDPEAPAPVATPTGRPRPVRRLLLAGGVVVAATATVVVAPMLSDEGEAFASWSSTPVELAGARRTAAVDACLLLQGDEGGELDFDPRSDASILVAEKRGGWSYVVFRVVGTSGTELQGSCLVPDDLVADPLPGEGGFFGGLSPAQDVAGPPPPRGAAQEDSSGVGVIGDGAFVYVEGRVGSDVTGIVVTTPGGQEVDASIANGHWAVWWPAGDTSMDNPEITEAPSYTVALRDGSTTDEVRNP